MAPLFELEQTFTITGRGLVLAGQIVEGVVQIGDHVQLPGPGPNRVACITGVELGHGPAPGGGTHGFVGLLVGELPPSDIPALQAALAPGQRLHVESSR